MTKTRVRLADIAAQAAVSEATVSRVLNDKPQVSAAARRAVLTAMDLLGVERPGHLKLARAGMVGLITPELDNPIFPAYAQVIETELATRDYNTVLCTQTPGGVHEDQYTQMLLDRSASGIILLSGLHADSTSSNERYERLMTRVPLVLVNGHCDGLPVPSVSDDDYAAMDRAVAHLVTQGHRRIGLALGQARFVPSLRKGAGFKRAMHVYAPTGLPLIEHTTFGVVGGRDAATRLLAMGATAIVCGSDLMALGAVQAVRAAGLLVPFDVSVIGYDDSPLMGYTDPPLTTIRQDVAGISLAAVRALVDQIEGLPVRAEEQVFLPELVVRASTGPVKARILGA